MKSPKNPLESQANLLMLQGSQNGERDDEENEKFFGVSSDL